MNSLKQNLSILLYEKEKILNSILNYQISKYRVSNKEVFKNDDNYKVFVEVAFKKKELFKSLDKINID